MALTLSDTHQLATSNRFTAVIYGKPGVGKTTLAATLPPAETVILNTEAGLSALRKYPAIQCLTATAWDDVEQAIQWLPTAAAEKGWKWLVIDSLSEMAELCLVKLKAMPKYKADGRAMYGEFLEIMTRVCKQFRDMDQYNVVLLALPRSDKDYEGRTVMGLDLPGQSSHKIVGWFDQVLAYRIIQGADQQLSRWLVTREIDGWIAKDRWGVLEPYEQPNLSSIAAKVLGRQDTQGA